MRGCSRSRASPVGYRQLGATANPKALALARTLLSVDRTTIRSITPANLGEGAS